MPSDGVRTSVRVIVAVVAMLAVLVVVAELRRTDRLPIDETVTTGARREQGGAGDVESTGSPGNAIEPTRAVARRPALPERERRAPAYIENLVWGEVDLREARAVMPDNLYWKWGAPTSDPDELAAREEEKRLRNEQYGRVLSGDASTDEVEAYYDYRERLSTDYLEFARWMRNRYGDGLSEEFRGLLDVAIKLNAARLAQIPLDRERSLEHARKRAEIRADWKRQQEEFGELGD